MGLSRTSVVCRNPCGCAHKFLRGLIHEINIRQKCRPISKIHGPGLTEFKDLLKGKGQLVIMYADLYFFFLLALNQANLYYTR